MSNTVDLSAERISGAAVPAGVCAVYLDGVIEQGLSVRRIVWDGAAGFSYAQLICDDEERLGGTGRRISIRQIYSGGIGQGLPGEISVFEGRIEDIEIRQDGSGRAVVITARDFGAEMKRTTVYGRRVVCDGREPVFVEGQAAVFNEGGKADAFCRETVFDGKGYRMFAGRSDQAVHWTAASAIGYLLGEYVGAGRLIFAGVEQLACLAGEDVLSETDVNGLDLAAAIQKVCRSAGMQYCFEPVEVCGRFAESIVFYRPGGRGATQLVCQPAGGKFSVGGTNVCRFNRVQHQSASVRFVGLGGFKVYEATFGLVKAWDASLEGGGREMYSPLTNPDFESVRDVYRRWCLNEAGDYSGSPFNCGPAYDFGKVFGTSQYVQRRRQFGKALSRDVQGKSQGYYLEVSYNSGQSWGRYEDDFEVLENECGIWLGVDEFSDDFWQAGVGGTLAFRITATVASDHRLRFETVCGPMHSAYPVEGCILDRQRDFAYRQVSLQSIFYTQRAGADTADDTSGLVSYVRGVAENYAACDIELEVSTAVLELHWRPGQRVLMGPDSSDVCGIYRDSRTLFVLKRAEADFQKQQSVLEIEGGRGYR